MTREGSKKHTQDTLPIPIALEYYKMKWLFGLFPLVYNSVREGWSLERVGLVGLIRARRTRQDEIHLLVNKKHVGSWIYSVIIHSNCQAFLIIPQTPGMYCMYYAVKQVTLYIWGYIHVYHMHNVNSWCLSMYRVVVSVFSRIEFEATIPCN